MGSTKDQNLLFNFSLSCNIILGYWDASNIVVEAPEALTFLGFLHSCSRVFLWSGRLGHTMGLILKWKNIEKEEMNGVGACTVGLSIYSEPEIRRADF